MTFLTDQLRRHKRISHLALPADSRDFLDGCWLSLDVGGLSQHGEALPHRASHPALHASTLAGALARRIERQLSSCERVSRRREQPLCGSKRE